jgi:hypothetical protein
VLVERKIQCIVDGETQSDKWIVERMDRWMDGWIDEWMDGWIEVLKRSLRHPHPHTYTEASA